MKPLRQVLFLLSVGFAFFSARPAGAINSVVIESKSIPTNQVGIVRVFVENSDTLNGIALPFILRKITSFATYDSLVFVDRLSDPLILNSRSINPLVRDGPPDSLLIGLLTLGGRYLLPGPLGGIFDLYFSADVLVGTMEIDSGKIFTSRILFTKPPAISIKPAFTMGIITMINGAPILSGCPSDTQSVVHGKTFFLNLTGTDPENDPLVFRLRAGPGEIDSLTGSYSFITTSSDIGLHNIIITLSDPGHPDLDSCRFMLNVINRAPVVACPANRGVVWGKELSYQTSAVDPDSDFLIYQLLSFTREGGGSPTNDPVVDSTGKFVWQTSAADSNDLGRWVAVVSVSDNIAAPEVCSTGIDVVTFLRRGDVDNDGIVMLVDIVILINYLFFAGPAPIPILEAGNTNCDDQIDLLDVVYLVNYLFLDGSPPCE